MSKKIIIAVAIVFAVILVAKGFLISDQVQDEKALVESESLVESEWIDENEMLESKRISESQEMAEPENEILTEVEISTQEDVANPKIKQESKEVAEKFVRAFYKRNPDYNYAEAVKEFVSEEYYEFLIDPAHLERQTLDREQQEVVSLEFTGTSDEITEEHISYAVFIKGIYISHTGEETASEDMYVLTLEKDIEGKWKVIGSWANIRN